MTHENERPNTVGDLLARIRAGWRDFRALVAGREPAALTAMPAGGGWSAKDLLAHVSAWECQMLGRLRGLPPHVALGIDEALLAAGDFGAINAQIYERNRTKPLADVLTDLDSVHEELVAEIERLSDEDLRRPVDPAGRYTLLDSIIVRTYAHYAEHGASIREVLGAGAA